MLAFGAQVNTVTPKLFPTPPTSWSWVVLSGPDAPDFLHRVTTVHVRALSVGQGAEGCLLNPQGKIRAAFTLWRFGETDFAFEFDAGADGTWKRSLLEAIDQLTFSERQTLTDVPTGAGRELECRWIFDAESLAETELTTRALPDEVRLCVQPRAHFDRPWITAWGRPAALAQWVASLGKTDTVTSEELERARIRMLTPEAGAELEPEANPLEIGLGTAIAKDKGCYPGQEVIERTIAIGSPARRLARIEGAAGDPPAPKTALENLAEPAAEVGTLTSTVRTEKGWEGLALIRKIHAKEGLEVRVRGSQARATIRQLAPYA